MSGNLGKGVARGLLAVSLAWFGTAACSSSSDDGKDVVADIAQADTHDVAAQDNQVPPDTNPETVAGDVADLTPGDTTDVADTTDTTDTADLAGDLQEDAQDADAALPPCEPAEVARTLSDTADETFDLGPYLMMLKPDSVTIMWRTLEETDGVVLYGTQTPDQELADTQSRTVHEVVLTGLQPDTDYAYQVKSAGVTSAVHHFRTGVPLGQPFRFVVWGDNQNGPEIFAELLALMKASGPHIALGVGDHVQDGTEAALWKDQLFGPARAFFHQVPFYAAMGNHEHNSDFYRQLYSYPHPEDQPEHESYYSYTYGNAFFLVVDTNTLLCPIGDYEVPQSEFIKQALASPEAQKATWKFAYAHESAYSESWGDGECSYDGFLCLRNWLVPLLAENGFHAWFAGHTHDYERGSVDGMAHIITGGGGGSMDAWCYDWETTQVIYQSHHFMRVDAGCDTLRIETVNQQGEVVDWLVMNPDRTIVDQGPAEGLPEIIINSDSPTLD